MTLNQAIYQATPAIAIAVFFALWELTCRLFMIPVFILPAPSTALAELIAQWPGIWPNALHTLLVTIVGFGISLVFGLALGIAVGASALMYRAVNPLLIGFNAIPKVALVPILVMWFGIGTIPAVVTAFLTAFFPISVNVATGIATVEPELQDVLRSLGASRLDMIRKVGLPRAMPYFFASLKVAIALAFVGTVISETLASNVGIGYLMVTASSTFRVPLVFAGLIVIAVMGVTMYAAAAVLERRWTGWATRGHDPGAFSGGG
ncbi:MAG: ABC transporter permease [Xanthobacteraceae bacterium]